MKDTNTRRRRKGGQQTDKKRSSVEQTYQKRPFSSSRLTCNLISGVGEDGGGRLEEGNGEKERAENQ